MAKTHEWIGQRCAVLGKEQIPLLENQHVAMALKLRPQENPATPNAGGALYRLDFFWCRYIARYVTYGVGRVGIETSTNQTNQPTNQQGHGFTEIDNAFFAKFGKPLEA